MIKKLNNLKKTNILQSTSYNELYLLMIVYTLNISSFTLYTFIIIAIALLLLFINFIFSYHNPYLEKRTAFECGFHSFLGQNRTQFSISFFIFGLLFLLFDLEILLIYPYTISAYENNLYGLIIMLLFFILLTAGLVFELGKKALTISSKQYRIL